MRWKAWAGHRTLRRLAVASICLAIAVPLTSHSVSARAQGNTSAQQQQQRLARQVRRLRHDVRDLQRGLDHASVKLNVALIPVALLVAILALGGGLGVVFSIRDQRRISQLHELTVAGEVSSQRRAEQGYASFLDQSQTTLALVNDTLKLAKDATDREARSLEIRAQQQIDTIEETAQQLMLETFVTDEFELIVEDPARRERLHALADELRALESQTGLKNVPLPPYTKFVKAIDRFLSNDPDTAINILRRTSEERLPENLRRFVLYWLGYVLTTVGQYQEALTRFKLDDAGLPERHPEHFQLMRVIVETEFFDLGKRAASGDPAGADPRARFRAALPLLNRLRALAAEVKTADAETSDRHEAYQHVALAIARTRADILEWVAYDHEHLDDRIDADGSQQAVASARTHLAEGTHWETLSHPDTFRAWALVQAEEICLEQRDENDHDFALAFALAECQFKLGEEGAAEAFLQADGLLKYEFGRYREQRRETSLQQSALICHSRLLRLRQDAKKRTHEARQVTDAFRDTLEALAKVRPTHVTVFSHIQRRNITQEEFREEVREILEQERGDVQGAIA